jgi:hypothetical protein
MIFLATHQILFGVFPGSDSVSEALIMSGQLP